MAQGPSGPCRILVLQTMRANRLHEFDAVCAALRGRAPGCEIAVLVPQELQWPVAALGCAREVVAAPGRFGALLGAVRRGGFDQVLIVRDGAGPGQMGAELLALAARPRRLWWCVPGGAIHRTSRGRLAARIAAGGVLAGLALVMGAGLGLTAAAGLAAAGAARRFSRRGAG